MFEKNGKLVTNLWILLLLTFYISSAFVAGNRINNDKIQTELRQQSRLDKNGGEIGNTQVNIDELNTLDNSNYDEVKVGIYVDRIIDISAKQTGWTVDFYIWFHWDNDEINPGETFQVVNGEVLSKTELNHFPWQSNGTNLSDIVQVENGVLQKVPDVQSNVDINQSAKDEKYYALYRVTARITKFFNVVSYPLDHHLLTIRIEDKEHAWQRLRYLPDLNATEYSSRVQVPGYQLENVEIKSKQHAYKTNRGDPRLPDNYQAVYSQIIYGINIDRPDWGLYFKMFQGLFASVAIAFLAFILGVSAKERFSLGVGAFFASVGSSYINLKHLPDVGIITLIDMANGLAMGTIFLTLLGSALSSQIASNENQLDTAYYFNRASLILFITGFVSVNSLMAYIAVS